MTLVIIGLQPIFILKKQASASQDILNVHG